MNNDFIAGGLFCGCLVIGLFFLRFWRTTGDRLFLFFAAAFWLLGAHWTVRVFVDSAEEYTDSYWLRVAAFAVLLIGIWDKNRNVEAPPQPPEPPRP